jgi:hypothetical protein
MTTDKKPEWAKRLEDWGKEMEKRFSPKSCPPSEGGQAPSPNDTNENISGEAVKVDKSSWKRNNNPVGDIIGQLISYLVITYVPTYFPDFFLTGWSVVYGIIVYSIIIHVAVDIFLIVFNSRPIYYLGQVITNLAAVVSMLVMVTIFPFNFIGNIGYLVQLGLWIAIIVVSIVTLVDFLKIFLTNTST